MVHWIHCRAFCMKLVVPFWDTTFAALATLHNSCIVGNGCRSSLNAWPRPLKRTTTAIRWLPFCWWQNLFLNNFILFFALPSNVFTVGGKPGYIDDMSNNEIQLQYFSNRKVDMYLLPYRALSKSRKSFLKNHGWFIVMLWWLWSW